MKRLGHALAVMALVGCEGRIAPPTKVIEPPVPELACSSEQLCVGASGLSRLTAPEYEATVRAAFGQGRGAVQLQRLLQIRAHILSIGDHAEACCSKRCTDAGRELPAKSSAGCGVP